jgi:hypothetical protein
VAGRCEHNLCDILAIAVCAMISGADQFTEMQRYDESHEEWFASWLELPNGIPSHDTFTALTNLFVSDSGI